MRNFALQQSIGTPGIGIGASQVAQMVKNLPVMQETWVQSLGCEDPLENGKATPLQYSGLENSRTLQSMGSQRVGHD